jgi:hypothetical protein
MFEREKDVGTPDGTQHSYPRQVTRVGVAGYKGKVETFETPETLKARAEVEDKARKRGTTK